MKNYLIITTVLGVMGIILGAFATHTLQENLDAKALQSFETGIRYQMYHVIVLLFINTASNFSVYQKKFLSLFFFFGILFFSGSIYAIHLLDIDPSKIWFVTPIGGLTFVLGWIFMLIFFLKGKEKK